jgi:hypothetical protein
MKYMPILPIGMSSIFKMEEVSSAFILPQFWSNPRYAAMYTSRSWDTVIIDNAMYENPQPVPFNSLIDIAESLQSCRTFIVAPEDHNDPINTIRLVTDCIDTYGKKGTCWEPMTIIHGKPNQIRAMFDMLDTISTMAYGIAVSCWRAGYDRTMLKSLSTHGIHYFHAMGLDSITEGIALRRAGFDSVDSSMVATAAVNKIHMDLNTVIFRTGASSDPVRVPLLQDNFQVECIEHTVSNLIKMYNWISGDS